MKFRCKINIFIVSGCQMTEEISIENIKTTQNKFPMLRTYQKVDRSSIENCVNKNNVLPEDMSKSSEKNDKLMSYKNTLKSNFKCGSLQNNDSKTLQTNYDNVVESSSNFKLNHTLNSSPFSLDSEISLQKSTNVFKPVEPIFETKSNGSIHPDFDRDSKCKGYAPGTHFKPSELNIKIKDSSESGCINEAVTHQEDRINMLALVSNQHNTACKDLSPQQASQSSLSDSVSMPINNKRERKEVTQNTEKRTYFSRSQIKKLEQTAKCNDTGMFSINCNQDTRSYSKDDNERHTFEVKKVQNKMNQSSNMDSNVSFFYHGRLTKERIESNRESTSEQIIKKTEFDNYDEKSLLGQNFSLLKPKEGTLKMVSSLSNFEADSQDEEFLGTNNELNMKDQTFSGFQEDSDKNQSTNVKFRDFLRRLSESENETSNLASVNTSEESPYESSNESFSLESPTKQSNSVKKCTDKNNISTNVGTLDAETSCLSYLSNCKSMDINKTSIIDPNAKKIMIDKKKFDIEINCSEMENLEISLKERIKESLMEIKQQFKSDESSFKKNNTTTSETVKDKFDLISNETNSSYFDRCTGGQNIKRNEESSNGNGFKKVLKKTKENKMENNSFTKLSNEIEVIVLDNDIDNCNDCEMKGNETINKEMSSHFTDNGLCLLLDSSLEEDTNKTSKATCTAKDAVIDTQTGLSLIDSTVENQPRHKKSHKSQSSPGSLIKKIKLQTGKTYSIKSLEKSEIKKSLKKDINEHNSLTSDLQSHSPVENKDTNYFCADSISEVRNVETRLENNGLLCSKQSANENDRSKTEHKLACVNVIHEEIPPNSNTPIKRGKKQKLTVLKNESETLQKNENVILHVNEHKSDHYSQKSNKLKLSALNSPLVKLNEAVKEESVQDLLIHEKLNGSNNTIPVFVTCEQGDKYSEEKDEVKEDLIKLGEEEKNNSISKNIMTLKVAKHSYTDNTAISSECNNTKSSPSILTMQDVCYSNPQNKRRGRPPKVKFDQTINSDLLKCAEIEKNYSRGKNCNTPKVAANNHSENTTMTSVCTITTLPTSTSPIQEVCNDSPQKKRRGRPPKVKLNQTVNGDLLKLGEVEKNNSLGKICNNLITAANNLTENTTLASVCNDTTLSPSALPIQEICNSSPQKKRRGRPSKVNLYETVNRDLLQLEEVEKNNLSGKDCDTPKVATNNYIENTSSSSVLNNKKSSPLTVPMQEVCNSSPQKKRRGRPPKVNVIQIDKTIIDANDVDISAEANQNDSLLENEKSPKFTNPKRNDKPFQEGKLVEPIVDSSLCNNKNNTLPKKRGRPPKAKVSYDKVEMSASDDDSVPLSKRVKHVIQNNDNLCNVNTQEETTVDKVFHETKKPLQRRKKIVFDEYSDEESPQILEPVKKPLCKSKKRYSHFKNGLQVYFSQNYTSKDKVSK